MESSARAAAEVFIDLLQLADPSRASAPTDQRLLKALNRLTREDALTFHMNSRGEVLLGAGQLVVGVMTSLDWLLAGLVESSGVPRATVLANLKKHIAAQ